jgi:S1-C subfamily serine protease
MTLKLQNAALLFSLVKGANGFLSHPSTTVRISASDFRLPYTHGDTTLEDTFSILSMSELKHLLSERGVDFRDCVDKRDLLERLRRTSVEDGAEPFTMPPLRSAALFSQEESLISTFKAVSPSVANIQTQGGGPQEQRKDLNMPGMEFPEGTGSGFLWDNSGHVVTNYHVVSGGRNDGVLPSSVSVKLTGMASALDAEVIGVDAELDLALLKLKNVDSLELPNPIPIGQSNDLQVGQSVMAIGNPFGLDDTLTTGVISALGRDIDGIGGRPIGGCIQTDAAINPGMYFSRYCTKDIYFENFRVPNLILFQLSKF